MTSEEWLAERAPGLKQLPAIDRSAINDFIFLWSLFEAQIMENFARSDRIRAKVEEWAAAGSLEDDSYDDALRYFRDRYFDGGIFTPHFAHLHLRAADHEGLVRSVIDGSNDVPRDRMLALLMIVWRLRNNLFHGVKWSYERQGQLENFRHANSILMRVLERHAAMA